MSVRVFWPVASLPVARAWSSDFRLPGVRMDARADLQITVEELPSGATRFGSQRLGQRAMSELRGAKR